jgi:hypothetical protein
MIDFFIALFWIFCGIVIAVAILYLVASIEVHNEMKKAKEEELSLKNHNWKKFKNKPWNN